LKLRDAPGIDVVYGSTTNGGGSIEWFRHIAGELPIEALLAEAEAAPAGSDGLIFVPYLAGERAPLWRSDLSGAFVGLRASHTRGHLARSILEGCAFSKRHVLDLTRALGSPRLLKLAGGTARSMLWNRIRAAVLGLPARVLPSVETAALGAIFLSASHIDPTLRERYSKVSISEMIVPDPIWQSVYVEAYGRYLACAVRA